MERYVEVVYDHVSHRKGEVQKVSSLSFKKLDRVMYTTMFQYTDYIFNYLELSKTKFNQATPTVKEYDGELYIPYIWIDIDVDKDEKDLMKSLNITRALIEKLNFKYSLPYESMVIFFSGGKGFHVGINSKIFGAEDFKTKNAKAVARYVVDDIVEGRFKVDYKIYDTTRLFRAPYSLHSNEKYYKVDIDYNYILELNLEKILSLAKECKREISYKYKFELNEQLKNLFNESVKKSEDDKENVSMHLEKTDLLENESIFKVPEVGDRNYTLFRQAFRLFSVKELKNNEVADIMKFIYYATNEIALKTGSEPISDKEFNSLIKSAFQRSRVTQTSSINQVGLAALVKTVFNKVKNAKYIDTCIREYNSDLRGGFVVENLYSLIGRGGTMKSIYACEVAMENARNGSPSVYANMEMSNIALFDRIYLRVFMKSFIAEIQAGNISESDIQGIEYQIEDVFKSNFRLIQDVDLEAKDMLSSVQKVEDDIKRKVSLLVVDSMNAMKMHGDSEAITAFQNTKYLKEVSKKGGFCTLLINHVTQQCPYTLRDCAPYVRGGSKVLDNCDAYISFSYIVDKDNSDFRKKPADIVYESKMKYMRLVNKRDTGNTIDKIIRIEDNLSISMLEDKPSKYEYHD